MTYEEIVQFHGHECPGLAIGYRMARAAMDKLESMRAADEELVAIVENDACGVDALQCVTGCTFGKGNLLFRDYGKQVYTIYSRSTRTGVRVVFNRNDIPEDIREDRTVLTNYILHASADSVLSVTITSVPEPERAKIRSTVCCAICDENVMESRVRNLHEKTVCIPCYEKQQKLEKEIEGGAVNRDHTSASS